MISFRTLAVTCVVVAGMSTGCAKLSGLFGPKATTANIELRASPDMNPDDSGRPSPLRLRLYELKTDSAFNAKDFFSLYERDNAVLGADLVAKEEIQLEPGMTKSFSRKLNPDTKFLAVLAPYRKIEQAKWRASLEVPQGKTTGVLVDVGKVAVTLAPSAKKK